MHDEQPVPRRRVVRHRSAEDRERLMDEFKASGLTQRAFAERAGIHPETLSQWLRKVSAAQEGFTELSVPIAALAPIVNAG